MRTPQKVNKINLSVPAASPARYSKKLFPAINDHRHSVVNYVEESESTREETAPADLDNTLTSPSPKNAHYRRKKATYKVIMKLDKPTKKGRYRDNTNTNESSLNYFNERRGSFKFEK